MMTSLALLGCVAAMSAGSSRSIAVGPDGALLDVSEAPDAPSQNSNTFPSLASELSNMDVHCFDQKCGADLKATRQADPKGAAMFDCLRYSTHMAACIAGTTVNDLSPQERRLFACGLDNACVQMKPKATSLAELGRKPRSAGLSRADMDKFDREMRTLDRTAEKQEKRDEAAEAKTELELEAANAGLKKVPEFAKYATSDVGVFGDASDSEEPNMRQGLA